MNTRATSLPDAAVLAAFRSVSLSETVTVVPPLRARLVIASWGYERTTSQTISIQFQKKAYCCEVGKLGRAVQTLSETNKTLSQESTCPLPQPIAKTPSLPPRSEYLENALLHSQFGVHLTVPSPVWSP